MKKFSLLALGLFVALSLQARAELLLDTTRPIFDQLSERFATGFIPNAALGWYSGRCYAKSFPSLATNGLLVMALVTTQEGSNNDGPLFPPTQFNEYKLSLLGNGSQIPDYYDTLDSNPALQMEIQRLVDTDIRTNTSTAIISDNALQSTYLNGNLKFRVRQGGVNSSGDYLFAQAVILNSTDNQVAGEVYQNCYYFKKVK